MFFWENEYQNYAQVKDFLLENETNKNVMDIHMMNYCNEVSSAVVRETFPNGCQLSIPKNYFLLMILAGAKGSKVNMSQILACLGQQSLEGQRVTIHQNISNSFFFVFCTLQPTCWFRPQNDLFRGGRGGRVLFFCFFFWKFNF